MMPDRGTASYQAHRDLTFAGFGILALGILGVIAALLAMTASRSPSGTEVGVLFVGGAFLLVFAGSIVAGAGLVRRLAPAAGGCGSVALGAVLGGLLFVASLGFLFMTRIAVASSR